jgi:hypothetical protein
MTEFPVRSCLWLRLLSRRRVVGAGEAAAMINAGKPDRAVPDVVAAPLAGRSPTGSPIRVSLRKTSSPFHLISPLERTRRAGRTARRSGPWIRAIYRAETEEPARARLDDFEAEWGRRYPAIG